MEAGAIQTLLCMKTQNRELEPVTSLGFSSQEGLSSLMCLGLLWSIKPWAP